MSRGRRGWGSDFPIPTWPGACSRWPGLLGLLFLTVFPAGRPVTEQDLSVPFLPEFNGFSYLELSGLQSFVPDLQ